MSKNFYYKINEEINFPQVRLVEDGNQLLMSSYEANKIARSREKDLILINESQTPPIVKIDDYNKFIYNLDKAQREKKKNSIKSEIKEIQLSCEIADNDLNTKSKKGIEFLSKGDKVKCVLQLKGRQKMTPQRGEIVMLKFADSLSTIGTPEALPKLESNRWIMTIKPRKKNS